jgi:hypothetical protein
LRAHTGPGIAASSLRDREVDIVEYVVHEGRGTVVLRARLKPRPFKADSNQDRIKPSHYWFRVIDRVCGASVA